MVVGSRLSGSASKVLGGVGGVGGWVVLPIIVSLQSSLELGVWTLSFELDWTSTGLSLDNLVGLQKWVAKKCAKILHLIWELSRGS